MRSVVRTIAVRAGLCGLLVGLAGGVTGCGPAGLDNGLLGVVRESLPTPEEVEAYRAELQALQERAANLPAVPVRIVNQTTGAVRVVLGSALDIPASLTGPGHGGIGMDEWADWGTPMWPTDRSSVIVAAGGTASGALKCGDALAVGVLAPLDALASLEGYERGRHGGLVGAGNVVLTGAGNPVQSEFTGDTVQTVRVIRPATDGLNCGAQTIVVTITAAATESVYDPQTGALVAGATPGTGTISFE